MSFRTKLWAALGLVVLGLLVWKLGIDWARAVRTERGDVAVTGFRSAHFGDAEEAVRAAIEKDFPGAEVQSAESPVERTKLLVIRAKDILPGSGNAQVIYVLGYRSKALIQVNVFWGTQLTPDITPRALGITAALLKQHFAAQDFVAESVVQDKKLATGAVLVFSGSDAAGHLVRLLYQEADVPAKPVEQKPSSVAKTDKEKKDAAVASVEPKRKVAALRLSYVKDPKNPDIFKVEDGAF